MINNFSHTKLSPSDESGVQGVYFLEVVVDRHSFSLSLHESLEIESVAEAFENLAKKMREHGKEKRVRFPIINRMFKRRKVKL